MRKKEIVAGTHDLESMPGGGGDGSFSSCVAFVVVAMEIELWRDMPLSS